MKKTRYFDDAEKTLITQIEKDFDEYVPVVDDKVVAGFHQAATHAHETLRKSSQINMRVNPEDIALIKAKAKTAGIPYQTYISLILRQVARGDMGLRL